MKTFKIYAMMIATALLASLSACNGGDDDDEIKPDPKLNFKTTAGYTFQNASVGIDSNVKAGIIISHDRNITNVKFSVTLAGSTFTVKDTNLKEKNVNLDFMRNVISAPGTEKWTITATDADGKTGTAEFTLTVTGADPDLTDYVASGSQENRKIYNKNSSKPLSALNLDDLVVYSAGVAVDDKLKDVFDDNTTTTTYTPKWSSKSGARFVKVTGGLDYATTTKYSQIVNYYNGRTNTASTETLAKDNMYVVKGGDENRYYLIYVINVVDAAGQEDDYVEIKVKALPL